jgi:hypothetical protein
MTHHHVIAIFISHNTPANRKEKRENEIHPFETDKKDLNTFS